MLQVILSVGIKIGAIDLDLQAYFRRFDSEFLRHSVCPRDKSSPIWATFTKFAQNMHVEILLAGIENGVIDFDLQGHLAISTSKAVFKLLLYTDLHQPRAVTSPKCAVVQIPHIIFVPLLTFTSAVCKSQFEIRYIYYD